MHTLRKLCQSVWQVTCGRCGAFSLPPSALMRMYVLCLRESCAGHVYVWVCVKVIQCISKSLLVCVLCLCLQLYVSPASASSAPSQHNLNALLLLLLLLLCLLLQLSVFERFSGSWRLASVWHVYNANVAKVQATNLYNISNKKVNILRTRGGEATTPCGIFTTNSKFTCANVAALSSFGP